MMSRILKAIFNKTPQYLIISRRNYTDKKYPSCSLDNKPKKDKPINKPESSDDRVSDSGVAPTRPIREEPAKVRLGFIPESWIADFYNKTGATGFYVFCFTYGTYLMSKEKFVMEHNYYGGVSFAIMWWLVVTKAGPLIAKTIDKEIDALESSWNEGREHEKNILDESIKDEEKGQWSMDGQLMLIEAKRENVALQLEADYRQRLMTAYTDTKNLLDYQVELQNIERRILQKNIIDWVTAQVRNAITPEEENKNIDQCIADLALMGGGGFGGSTPEGGGSSSPPSEGSPPSGGSPSGGELPPTGGSTAIGASPPKNVCQT